MTVVYATFDELNGDYEGTIPATDRARVESLLRRASARLTQMMPSVPYRVSTGDLDPELPAGLVIEAVLRVYRNPEGTTREQIGPFSKEFNPRGVAAEISLDPDEVQRLLAPIPAIPSSFRVGLPSVEQVLEESLGINPHDLQLVAVNGAPTAGTFTLSFGLQTTPALAYNTTTATVLGALQAIVGPGNVSVTGDTGGPWTVIFGHLTEIPLMTATSALTGGTSPTVTVSLPSEGPLL